MLLEIAGRPPHRRPLGRIDGLECPVVNPITTLECRQEFSPLLKSLRLRGHRFSIDGVCLDAGTGVGFVITSLVDESLRIVDLDLQTLARTRLLGDRPQMLERSGLLFDLEGRGVAERRQRFRRFPPNEPPKLGS